MIDPVPEATLPPVLARWLADAGPAVRETFDWIVAAGMGGTFARSLADAGPAALAAFFADAAACDRAWVARHRDALRAGDAGMPPPGALSPIAPGRLDGDDRDVLARAGRDALAAGRWAALVFAGGAATRFFADAGDDPRVRAVVDALGSAPPKGLFPLTPVLGRSFLDRFAAETMAAGVASGVLPPLLLLSSGATDGPIREWTARANLGGLPRDAIRVVRQAEHPRLDADGNLVVRPDGRLVRTGDGHGGVFRALLSPGPDGTSAADDLRAAGVDALVLHNVDNAAARPFEPARLGWFDRAGCGFAMTVVVRTKPAEKVGLVAVNEATGRIEVVEYSVCPRELAEATGPDGLPRFHLAHINTNLVRIDAVRADLPPTLYTGKRVAVGDRLVETSSHEMLNQHLSGLLPRDRVGVLLVDRDAYFLPTKSVAGEDSLETTVAAMIRRDADRLRRGGAEVAPDAVVELDPCLGPDDAPPPGAARGWRLGAGAALGLAVRHGLDGPPWRDGLVLEDGASLAVAADRPYGRVLHDPTTRRVAGDPASAGRLALGRDVRVRAGVAVRIRLRDDGVLRVADGTVFDAPCDLDVGAGEFRRIG